MIGYLKPDVNELRVRELKLYNAYYCGICTGLSKKYGPVSRLLLSYDSTFFVILSDALSGSQCQFAHARCPLPPFQKKRIVKSEDMRFGMEISKFFSDLKIDDFKRDSKGFMPYSPFFCFISNLTTNFSEFPNHTPTEFYFQKFRKNRILKKLPIFSVNFQKPWQLLFQISKGHLT
jgi:hypothetical protein